MPDDDTSTNSRSDRLARRRHRIRWVAVLVVALIVLGAGTVAAFTMTDEQPAVTAATTVPEGQVRNTSGTEHSLGDVNDVASTVATRPLSNDEPLRLWVGGDSLSGALGMALGEMTSPLGIVKTTVDYKISSGLTNNIRDWPDYAESAMKKNDPEVVVFMVGANDTKIVNSHDADDDGVPDWEPEYRAKVADMMDMFVGDDDQRTVVWIGSPPLRSDKSGGAEELDRVMREEAAKRRPNVLYVDAYELFSSADGGYTDTLKDENGKNVRVRIGDGVHLTPAGGEYLANAVFTLLDTRWKINEQSDPEHRIGYTILHGGESTDSGRGSGTGSSSGGGKRSGTTTSVPDDDDDGSTGSSTSSPPATGDPTASTTPPSTTETSTPGSTTPTTGGQTTQPTPTTTSTQ
jgi:hypothetical protein